MLDIKRIKEQAEQVVEPLARRPGQTSPGSWRWTSSAGRWSPKRIS